MLAKLEEVEARYEQLTQQLADPAITKDQKVFRQASKEHADLAKVVEAYRELKATIKQIADNQQLIAENSEPELCDMAKDELLVLEPKKRELEERVRVLLLPKDPRDEKSVILEVRAGTGGDEAALFAGELYRMYSSYAEQLGYRTEIMQASEGSQGGFKEVIVQIAGTGAYSAFKYESGVHRVQRVPATESQGRIHTSAVTVAVLPEAEEIDIEIKEADIRVDVYRSSGPGGQSVNTTDSAVRITHIPTGMVVAIQDEKSQHKNRAKALRILRARLLDKMQAEEEAKRASERRSMVKSGDRSEKIRTYNYPQDRLTDHRIGLTVHNLPSLLAGDIGDVVSALRTHYQAEALKSGGH
jgi:peptide chain release factor 1